MFDRPQMLWLLLALPLIVAPGLLAIRAGKRLKGALATAIRLACFVALVFALAGLETPLRSGRARWRWWSRSINRALSRRTNAPG